MNARNGMQPVHPGEILPDPPRRTHPMTTRRTRNSGRAARHRARVGAPAPMDEALREYIARREAELPEGVE